MKKSQLKIELHKTCKSILKELLISNNKYVAINERNFPILLSQKLKKYHGKMLTNNSYQGKTSKSEKNSHSDLTILKVPIVKYLKDKIKKNVLAEIEIKSSLNMKINRSSDFYRPLFKDISVIDKYKQHKVDAYLIVFNGFSKKNNDHNLSIDGFKNYLLKYRKISEAKLSKICESLIWIE